MSETLTQGLFISHPYLYKDPETGETRNIVDRLYGSHKLMFAGNAKRPVVHVLTDGKFVADALALDSYRKSKIADGYGAEIVDKHISRLSNPSDFMITPRGSGFVLRAVYEGREGPPPTFESWFGPIDVTKTFKDQTEVTRYLASCLMGLGVNGKGVGDLGSDFPVESAVWGSNNWQGVIRAKLLAPKVDWLVAVPATMEGRPVDDDGFMSYIGGQCINEAKNGYEGWCWKILKTAPKAFAHIRGTIATYWSTNWTKSVAPSFTMLRTNRDQNLPGITALGGSVPSTHMVAMFAAMYAKESQGWANLTVPPVGSALDGGLFTRGKILTMPDGCDRYQMHFIEPANGTVLGVDGAVVKRVWEELAIGFPQLADMIEFQSTQGSAAQKKQMAESIGTLREQPTGYVTLVQYATKQALPFDALNFLGLEKFAQRADTSVRKEKMGDDGKHVVTWGEANDRVNRLEEDDYFIVINDPETARLGFAVRPFVGTAATHSLYFSKSASGVRCRLALKGGSIVGGMDDLAVDDALNYSQLGYPFEYDLNLSALQDPRSEVRKTYFGGISEADLIVADPSSGSALNPDLALSQSLDISRLYEEGALFFPDLADVDKPVAALMNKGIDQPENLRALLQQLPVAVFGALISDASRYPNLD